ncbi:hypothetical protein RND81_12G015800 [Saponaria officinalis]|uniref:Glutaredoxin domain-containing protein n=1 Tax=Saponaria officinalis TaxID=3572 RepID=A0AAW1H222_SAPOF
MGCSASKFDTIIAKAIEEPSFSTTSSSSLSSKNSTLCVSNSSSIISSSMAPKTRSLSSPLVHHPALEKGDSHHLVCLTSSTYGSLDNNINIKNNSFCVEDDCFSGKSSPDSVINTWELMEGLEDDVNGVGFVLKSSNFCDFKNTQKISASKLDDFKVNLSNLCHFNDAQKNSASKLGLNSSNICDLGLNLSDSYVFVEMPDKIVEKNPNISSKPLWKHLSEESLLSKMDPNVCNAYDRALLAKKSVGSGPSPSPLVSKSKSTGSIAPIASKLPSDDTICRTPLCDDDNIVSKFKSSGSVTPISSKLPSDDTICRTPLYEDDKIVLYFTSLRGIRKTYEDCSLVRMILRGFRVVVDERDISMDSSYRNELQSALLGNAITLPQLFIKGKRIGGADDVRLLHESGELERILDGFPTKDCGFVCRGCGDARFVPCLNCNGSRKVFREEEGHMRRCSDCNENGLIRCPGCCS